jgi:hypothetical protein
MVSPWSLAGTTADLRTDTLVGRIDLRRPCDGLSEVGAGASGDDRAAVAACGGILRIYAGGHRDDAQDIVDSYVRGMDLVATYAPLAGGALQTRVYWRAVRSAVVAVFGLEMIVSVETQLLAANPTSFVESIIAAEQALSFRAPGHFEVLHWARQPTYVAAPPGDAGLFLFRLCGGRWSYVEMVHPADGFRASVDAEDLTAHVVRSRFFLFEERLERGVIRRGRIRGFLVPREDDEAAGVALFREFAASPPPLAA